MKSKVVLKIRATKPRNIVAQALFERDGEFKPRTIQGRNVYKRRPKNAREAADWQ